MLDRRTKRYWIDKVEPIRLTDRTFYLVARLARCEIDQRGDWIRYRYTVNLAAIGHVEIEPSMDAETRPSADAMPWQENVDPAAPRQKTPKGRCTSMTEAGAGSTGENRRHPATVIADFWPPHRIHASPKRMQAPRGKAALDRVATQPTCQQLFSCDHAMLSPNQRPQLS